MPLLIGGATTSAKHTAVKIAPAIQTSTVHVLDASRSAGVVDSLLEHAVAGDFDRKNRDEQRAAGRVVQQAAADHARAVCGGGCETIQDRLGSGGHSDAGVSRAGACLTIFRWTTIVEYIDWSPFFLTWELKGKYPRIFDDPSVGEEARKLFDDARRLLDEIVTKKLLRARGVYGFWPADAIGDDIARV